MILYAFPPLHTQTNSTWRKQTDSHQQHMFFLMQVELLQAHLKLHQRLQQLQCVARYTRYNKELLHMQ